MIARSRYNLKEDKEILCPVCETMGNRLLCTLHTQSGLEICNICAKSIFNFLRSYKNHKAKFIKKLVCNKDNSCERRFECEQCTFDLLRMLRIVPDSGSDTSSASATASAPVNRFDLNLPYEKPCHMI